MERHIALGFFDGVHRGHGALLSLTAKAAKESGGRACALTFDAHPEAMISGYRPPLLSGVTDRSDLMRRLYGIEEIIILPFDETLMRMPWDVFLEDILAQRFSASHIVAGHDFHFGYRNLGNAENLAAESKRRGIRCDVVPAVKLDGITVSSSYIRGLVAQGDMERAELFLGHPHTLYGRVHSGQRLGSGMGFPTANISLRDDVIVPAKGVYVSRIVVGSENTPHMSITNIGVRPSVMHSGPVIAETYIFDFDGSLYDKAVRVELLSFLRGERVFNGVEELYAQIRKDAEEARAIHETRNGR
jgi:riboflavin kinase/FMN adenylyltransferase